MLNIIFDALKAFAFHNVVIKSIFVLLLITLVVLKFLRRPQTPNFPIINLASGSHSFAKAVKEGYFKYPDTPFVLATSPPLVILPITYINEVKSLPENNASMMQEVKRVFTASVTDIGNEAHETIPAIKNDLTKHIINVLDGLQDEVRYSLDKEFGTCQEWTSQKVYEKINKVVALLSGRVFVGRPLSRNQDWLNITISYTLQCVRARDACNKYHPLLRPLICPFLKEVKDLKAQRQRGANILKPILDDILNREENGLKKPDLEEWEDEQGTFCSWMLKYADIKQRRNPLRLANNQMGLSFAAIHTTSMALSQAIFDLAARPEYIKPLREEIQRVISEDGQEVDSEGYINLKKTSFNKLKKLDSFLKESQRLNPPEIISMTRVTTSRLTLSTGLTLPKGTRFAFPSLCIHTSTSTTAFSPAYNPPDYTSPLEFDGLRFYKLRCMPGKENRHQFVTTAPDSIVFGHGTHACPGRFFAGNEIKVVLVELLRNWEMKMKDGEERPENMMHGFACVPNMTAEVEFRRLGGI